jgi:hypothetical protein
VTSPVPLEPAPPDTAKYAVTRGKRRPLGVAWFGFRSFWGPLYHLIASIIATEDIDSRDWMKPNKPRALARRVAKVLGGDLARKNEESRHAEARRLMVLYPGSFLATRRAGY